METGDLWSSYSVKGARVRVAQVFHSKHTYHSLKTFGLYRSPGGQISFLANTIEKDHDITARTKRTIDGTPVSPCRASIRCVVLILQDSWVKRPPVDFNEV